MDELEAIRQKKIEELKRSLERASYPDGPVTVTDADLAELISKYPLVVVDCWAEWCGPCRMIAPTIGALAQEYHGKVIFGKLNVDNNRATSTEFGITSIPTLLVFKDGKLADRIVGAAPKQMIEQKLQKFM